jgi:hypothetical protein
MGIRGALPEESAREEYLPGPLSYTAVSLGGSRTEICVLAKGGKGARA